jgi:hypothetical protein
MFLFLSAPPGIASGENAPRLEEEPVSIYSLSRFVPIRSPDLSPIVTSSWFSATSSDTRTPVITGNRQSQCFSGCRLFRLHAISGFVHYVPVSLEQCARCLVSGRQIPPIIYVFFWKQRKEEMHAKWFIHCRWFFPFLFHVVNVTLDIDPGQVFHVSTWLGDIRFDLRKNISVSPNRFWTQSLLLKMVQKIIN